MSGAAAAAGPACPGCDAPFRPEALSQGGAVCWRCRKVSRIEIFPALARGRHADDAAARRIEAGEAACFYHPSSKAVLICDGCGAFLCSLCDLDLGGRHLCPECFSRRRGEGSLVEAVSHRTLHDGIALGLALFPFTLIFWFAAVVTAPAALFVAIRHWNAPPGILPRSRAWSVAAIVLAGLQVLGMASLLAVALIKGFNL